VWFLHDDPIQGLFFISILNTAAKVGIISKFARALRAHRSYFSFPAGPSHTLYTGYFFAGLPSGPVHPVPDGLLRLGLALRLQRRVVMPATSVRRRPAYNLAPGSMAV
jgi:hypothetical protein